MTEVSLGKNRDHCQLKNGFWRTADSEDTAGRRSKIGAQGV